MSKIAVIGGGISGVSTAYEFARRGHSDFVLYEASSRLGGTVETVRQDGFVIECGPDSWVTEKPWARELAIELSLEAEIIPSQDAHRRTYLLEGNQLSAMPDGMRMMVPADLETIAASPVFSEKARQAYRDEPSWAAELKAFAAARPEDEDESVASLVQRHFGDEVAEKIAGPLLAGVFGGDIRRLSAAAVMAPFVKMEREHGSLVLALQQRQSRGANKAVFTTLKSGLQTLIERMTAAIPPSTIRLGEGVLSVARTLGGWEVTTHAESVSFDHVVFATPVHITRKLIASLNQELQALLDIEATSAVVAAFAFDHKASAKLNIPEGFGFLVPQRHDAGTSEAGPQLLACTFVNQKFAHRAPEGCVLLRAFYGGQSAPALMDHPDEAVLTLAQRRLSLALGELPPAKITLVRRWPCSLPQYAVGHVARVARVEAIVREIPGLHLIGNAFHGVGLPDLIRQGRLQASQVLRLA